MKKLTTILAVIASIAVIISAYMSAGYHHQTFSEMQCLRNDIARMGVTEQTSAEEPAETEETQEQAPDEQTAETEETQEQAPAEQLTETEETQEQAPAEQTAETKETPEQAPDELQVYVVNNNNLIPVKVVEGTLSSDCVHNPTDLGCPDGGYYRDLNFIFFGKKVSQVNWVNGNTFENKEAYFPKAQNATTSHLYFCMDEENSSGKADGVYSFTAITEDGKSHSFSIQYYKNDIIH
ncbi:MAG: hypothetical protein HFJ26_02250 [Clostridia bacterium]|nr:hypothetical protein [Clostridia bacterium]